MAPKCEYKRLRKPDDMRQRSLLANLISLFDNAENKRQHGYE